MLLRILTLISFIFFLLPAFSQADTVHYEKPPYKELVTWPEEISVRFDLGIGMMTNSFTDEIDNLKISDGPAGNFGIVKTHHYKGATFFRMELTFMNVQCYETMEAFTDTLSNGSTVEYSDGEVNKSVTYLTLPLIFGFESSGMYIGVGLQGGLMLVGKGYTINQAQKVNTLTKERVYADFDAGIRAILGVRVAPHFYLESSYYHGLGNVCSGKLDTYGQTWKISQLTLGIRYSFHYYKPGVKPDPINIDDL